MKVQKASRIGIVVGDVELRAAQRVDGRLVAARVPLGPDLARSVRQLITSSPFTGREAVVGLEGSAVLIESLVVPAGATKSVRVVCAERLKGDPVFNEEKAALDVAVANPPSGSGPSMVILAAVNRERIAEVMKVCREMQLQVASVEAAALAAWRASPAQGVQLRLLRIGKNDVVLAGNDSRLLFCRIVEAPIPSAELRATISRAASLLATDGFRQVLAYGLDDAQRERLGQDLGMAIDAPDQMDADPAALGLALDGPTLTEFTPPEERELRAKRSARKVRLGLSVAIGSLGLIVALVGIQRMSALGSIKEHLETRAAARTEAERELVAAQAELTGLELAEQRLNGARPGHLMSRLFALVANAAPENLLLEKVRVDDVENISEEPRAAARELVVRMHGLADADARLLAFSEALLETGAFLDVRVENSERVPVGPAGAEGVKFMIYARAETR